MRSLLILLFALLTLPVHAQSGAVEEAFFIDASGDAFTYYNLRSNRSVPAEAADSGGWDVAFKGTTILVRGGVVAVDSSFSEVVMAPADGYATDKPDEPAIPSGSGDGWFNYNPTTHEISPVDGRTFVLELKNGQFAKFGVTDYYKQEFTDQGPQPVPRYYSFRWVLSEAGSRAF